MEMVQKIICEKIENYTFESVFFKSIEIESVVVSAHGPLYHTQIIPAPPPDTTICKCLPPTHSEQMALAFSSLIQIRSRALFKKRSIEC